MGRQKLMTRPYHPLATLKGPCLAPAQAQPLVLSLLAPQHLWLQLASLLFGVSSLTLPHHRRLKSILCPPDQRQAFLPQSRLFLLQDYRLRQGPCFVPPAALGPR